MYFERLSFCIVSCRSVIYKEQVRLNQAAATALMARLEAQKAICDASEKDLHKKFKQRDELEKQIRPEWEQARKRSRMDDTLIEEREQKPVLSLPGIRPRTPLHKELRVFLEEEQKASEAGLSHSDDEKRFHAGKELRKSENNFSIDKRRDHSKALVVLEDDNITEHKFSTSEIEEENKHKIRFPTPKDPEIEEDEESRKQRGKGNVEKWLQMLLENAQEDILEPQHEIKNETNKTDGIIKKINLKFPQKEGNGTKYPESEDRDKKTVQEKDGGGKGKEKIEESEMNTAIEGVESSKASEERGRSQSVGKERKLMRSESFRAFRRIPSSPSIILGMKKGVDCIGKKPMVSGDDEDYVARNNSFLKSSIKTIKRTVKI